MLVQVLIVVILLLVATMVGWLTKYVAIDSKKGEHSGTMTLFCIAFTLLGCAAGSSPPLYPLFATLWQKTGLEISHINPIEFPQKGVNFELKEREILPLNLPPNTELVVRYPDLPGGAFVPHGGYTVPNDVALESVEIYLQNRLDGRTSSSIDLP